MKLTEKEIEIVKKIREIGYTELGDTIITIKLVKVGADFLPVVYKSKPVSNLGISKPLNALLDQMQEGLENKPALFTLEFNPEGSILVQKATIFDS